MLFVADNVLKENIGPISSKINWTFPTECDGLRKLHNSPSLQFSVHITEKLHTQEIESLN